MKILVLVFCIIQSTYAQVGEFNLNSSDLLNVKKIASLIYSQLDGMDVGTITSEMEKEGVSTLILKSNINVDGSLIGNLGVGGSDDIHSPLFPVKIEILENNRARYTVGVTSLQDATDSYSGSSLLDEVSFIQIEVDKNFTTRGVQSVLTKYFDGNLNYKILRDKNNLGLNLSFGGHLGNNAVMDIETDSGQKEQSEVSPQNLSYGLRTALSYVQKFGNNTTAQFRATLWGDRSITKLKDSSNDFSLDDSQLIRNRIYIVPSFELQTKLSDQHAKTDIYGGLNIQANLASRDDFWKTNHYSDNSSKNTLLFDAKNSNQQILSLGLFLQF